MRAICLLLIGSLAISACTSPVKHNTPAIKAPSVAAVKADIKEAEEAVKKAIDSSRSLGKSVIKLEDYSKRIDYKATLLLENWDK